MWQTMVASGTPQPSSQTVPHLVAWKTSTRPEVEEPPIKRTLSCND